MSFAEKICVNTQYTRSVNVERDANSLSIVGGYIPTTRTLQTLSRIADTFKSSETPRAWSLVGPYGTGKSSFAVFLAHILGHPEHESSKTALSILRKADGSLARRLKNITGQTNGHCFVLLTGSAEPLGVRLACALADAAADYWASRPGRNPGVIDELRRLSSQRNIAPSDLITAVSALQAAVSRSGGNGILVVIDELGKFLEYEARHHGANDIHLLQMLAEHAYVGHSAPLTLVVLLHQAFEQYAKGLGEKLRNEWAKVQGRFENVPFLESSEQVLRIVSAAISSSLNTNERRSVNSNAANIARQLSRAHALPGTLEETTAATLFAACYPLHPVSALLLPILCQKVAQNERTLFSYLGSQEPHGFRHSLGALRSADDWILPWEIYNYFIVNQPATVTDHFTHRRWAEVVTAVERLGDAPAEEIHLLQTVGLLNIIGAQGGLKASREIVGLSFPSRKQVQHTADELIRKSIIHFRKFNSEYRVWQGSDFDLDAAVEQQQLKLGAIELAENLNRRHALLPVVARKYSIENGALRYFVPTFVDESTYQNLERCPETARIILFLTDGTRSAFKQIAQSHTTFSELDVVAECPSAPQLFEVLGEVLALEAVRRDSQELNSDAVAQKEFKDRYAEALKSEQAILDALFENPATNKWYWRGEPLSVKSKRNLQEELSRVLSTVYYASPVIKNELINRDKPSAQANAARNKLLIAMFKHSAEKDLSIERFPAEKGLYRAILDAPGLHRRIGGSWQLAAPPPRDPYNFSPVWNRIDAFFEQSEKSPLAFTVLDRELTAPPYGVKAGVLPILYIAAFLVNQHELALYEDGVYTPSLTEECIERFTRSPNSFQVQRFRIAGMRASIFEQYSRVIYGDAAGKQTLLSIARPLAQFLGGLPEYTRKTRRVSKTAQQVREAFNLAKTPEKLLFEALPEACGIEHIHHDDDADADGKLEGFTETLTNVLRELRGAFENLLDRQRRLFCQAFGLSVTTSLEEVRRILSGRLTGLDRYTVDLEGLRGFIVRATNSSIDNDSWFSNLLMFIAKGKAPKKWSDSDADAVEFRLSEYARRLNDLEKLRVHYEGEKARRSANFEVVLLRAVRQGTSEVDELVSIDDRVRLALASHKETFRANLSDLGDKELQLALLAEIVDEFLTEYRSSTNAEAKAPRHRPRRKDGTRDD